MQDLQKLEYQLDLLTSEIPDTELMDHIMSVSTRVQHLLDEEPRVSRWWFPDFATAMGVAAKCSRSDDLTYRLVCVEAGALFLQQGSFMEP